MKRSVLGVLLSLIAFAGVHAQTGQGSAVMVEYTGFTVRYNPSHRQPDWVEYTLTAAQVQQSNNSQKVPRNFMPDPNLHVPQAEPADYRKSGWVRGHMARRQDMKWSAQAVKESDYYTNICPQHEVLNNGVWHQIENLVRRLATRYDSVHVVCGPLFVDTTNGCIGPHRLPVPDSFFKALLIKDASGYHAVAFLCPNDGTARTVREVAYTVDQVEARTKVDVYSYLPDAIERAVERTLNLRKWGIK